MPKRKNFTGAGANRKAHRNGIHKAKKSEYETSRGVDVKFIRNRRFALRGDKVQFHRRKARFSKKVTVVATETKKQE
eukprot:gnl/Chilomastix_caulleri/7105.p1 GENE.gnl/Chilomastix_caulleri/7105~~gnl/Chilomastix_caulleri/7105.p1  ORF type:complete len:77 (+),score=24.95 gnl/Chilomastix_caulleri/7105:58-288(+)